jgi:hypothetical protein
VKELVIDEKVSEGEKVSVCLKLLVSTKSSVDLQLSLAVKFRLWAFDGSDPSANAVLAQMTKGSSMVGQ